MTTRTLYFTGPGTVTVSRSPIPDPDPGTVRVRTAVSAISAGTERLLYRDEAPPGLTADETIDALEGDLSYPISYGYAATGHVTAVGEGVDGEWLGRRVFAYNPHESHFLAEPADVLPIPEDVSVREAALFANAETAVTFVLDGNPTLGERVAVLGQGVVGLLTTALLAANPLETLVTFDRYERRRDAARTLGADRSLDPDDGPVDDAFERVAGSRADLSYEVSGNPDALDDAIATTGYDGRVIVGSWYGTRESTLALGGRFHRDRIAVRSSQVSTIEPTHRGRWDRSRRHDVAWEWLRRLDVESLLTHEFPLEDAADAYRLLEQRPEETLQVLLTYD